MKLGLALGLGLAMIGADAGASDPPSEAAEAAGRWVTKIDAGDYARSWSEAGTLFRSRVTGSEWARQAASAREPLGAVVTRRFKGETKSDTLPGAPDGRYDVVTFETELAKKHAAVETVVLANEEGAWKVVGYFVR